MIHTLETQACIGPFSQLEQQEAIKALEGGKVIYLPQLPFKLGDQESEFLTPTILENGPKNISFNPLNGAIKGTICVNESANRLTSLMSRFSTHSRRLLNHLIPRYQYDLITGRTSYRPIEVEGRKSSVLKDDTRLHVDAFPATPNQGKRILRIFSNVNPYGKTRHWHLGEPFETVVEKFRCYLNKPLFGSRSFLSWLKITKSYRSLYDHYMLRLHNQMKLSDAYQQEVSKISMHFPPGSTWIVMTDHVSHAALSGQYLLEQTFYLPVSSMLEPLRSPLKVLEKILDRKLV